MDKESIGVRDEIGFLLIHQRYADRFFPGTSVLHTRARYAIFVPWLFEDVAGLTGLAAERAVRERETELAGRLKHAGESQVIGSRVYPSPSSQPPSIVYWNALGIWGILRSRPDGRTMSRAQAHRMLTLFRATTDDDGQPLINLEPPFVPLPTRPVNWRNGHITLRLTAAEAAFLRERLIRLRRDSDHELSLLARLARMESAAPPEMWDNKVRAIAGPDASALVRARQAASLACLGRAIYDVLVERMVQSKDGQNASTRHHNHLKHMLVEHGPLAANLDIDALESDVGVLPLRLRAVMTSTKDWVSSKQKNCDVLFEIYAAAEARKGHRARLALTPDGRARRLEWSSEEHSLAEPLHYRWEKVSTLLNDLADAG